MLVAGLIALGAALLYLPQLRDAPFYLNRDEMFFGLTAHSMASTGHDTMGRLLPLYFQTQMRYGSEMWFQPVLMYAITLSVKLLGLSEGTIRLPMALAGVADVVLVYFIGRLLFGRELLAVAAAVLLALTPAHLINSRIAMDFQAPLPFILGWLLCLLLYMRRGNPRLLSAAGMLLGIGVYSYIAAYMLMPIYALLTCVVLYLRREPLKNYGVLAIGFILPVLCCLPYLSAHPSVLHDVFWHYAREKPQDASAADLLAGFVSLDRFATAVSVYWRFWGPRFLFIDGPHAMWVAGAFLVPASGLLAAGLLHAPRRSVSIAVLLIGGLLTAPIPASLVGDVDAIHRAAAVLPFGVLLAVLGLDALWSSESWRARSVGFVAVWGIVIGLAVLYHDVLPRAQAMNRAASVPLVVAGLYLLSRDALVGRARPAALAIATIVTLGSMEIAYAVFSYSTVILVSAGLVVIALVSGLPAAPLDRRVPPVAAALVLAAASSLFMYAYADYSGIHRVQMIPASAIVLAVRLLYTSCGLAVIVGVALLLRRIAFDGLSPSSVCAYLAVTIGSLQFAYFHIDFFRDYRWRLLHAIVVLAVAAAAARLAKGLSGSRLALGPLTAAAMLGVVSIQFSYFYVDYFTHYRARSGNFEPEGNGRVAWEAVIDRAQQRSVPAIYLGSVGPYGFGDLYWSFYAIKHHREDLLTRTVSDVSFTPGRIRALPDASLVVTSPSPERDVTIDRMVAAGEVRSKTLVTAPDGVSRFWILETAARIAMAVR